ncbi:MAG: hypothetical protein J0L92_41735 [Deltaproteobacteria bacterium]|nr:hypothetical protein [Deltaproteobacteria bacterium]
MRPVVVCLVLRCTFSLWAFGLWACGPSIPTRYVIEHDLDALSYRRYQRVLDVELPVEGNAAVGHTATYVRRSDEANVPYVNAFVTVYDHAPGLAAEIRAHLDSLASYQFSVVDIEGGRAFALDGGPSDRWWLWVSANRVVKIGGTADEALVRRVISAYMGMYPSDLDEHGRAREGTPSAGHAASREPAREEGLDLPQSLRGSSEGESSGGEAAP